MAKKIKTPNQFGATDGTATATETKAPGDETPKVTIPAVRTKKDGSPRKVREPRITDERMDELLKAQEVNLKSFLLVQSNARYDLRGVIDLEARTLKAAAKMEKALLRLNPEEQAWLLKANAEKLAAAGAPAPEQKP